MKINPAWNPLIKPISVPSKLVNDLLKNSISAPKNKLLMTTTIPIMVTVTVIAASIPLGYLLASSAMTVG